MVRDLAAHDAVITALTEIFGTSPIPFQTLNFTRGTEQSPHADSIHFDTVPHGSMCGVWVALETVGESQGPLRFYPGSHTIDVFRPRDHELGNPDQYSNYERRVEGLLESAGSPSETFVGSPGDVIVWHADLLHGGAPIGDATLTRHSQVTHYFFGDAPRISPLRSAPERDHYLVRDPIFNIATGRRSRSALPPEARAVADGLTYLPTNGASCNTLSLSSNARRLYRRARFEVSHARLKYSHTGRNRTGR